MADIRLITFDLDNTLWDVDGLLLRAEQGVYDWLREACPAIAEHYTLDTLFKARVRYWRAHPELEHQISRMRLESLGFILRELGYPEAEANRLSHRAFEVFMDFRHRVTYFDHALAALESLNRAYTIGALSNGNACTRRLGIDNYFDFHYSAEQLNAGKPEPALFRAALAYANVKPAQMIHIGDNPTDDICGAAELGIYSIWFNRSGVAWAVPDVTPTATVSCLSELPEAVAAIARQAGSLQP